MRVDVAAFSIDRHNVTNGEYLEFMKRPVRIAPHFWTKQRWRSGIGAGMFELQPLPLDCAGVRHA